MRKLYRGIILFLILSTIVQAVEELKLSFLVLNGKHRTILRELVKEFEFKNPDIKIKLIEKNNDDYHEWFKTWQQTDTDILWWFAGYQLNDNARQGHVYEITELWQKNDFGESFPALKSTVSDEDGRVYGMPISYYQWGFYYNKDVFKKHNFSEPKTWDEFLALCNTMKSKGLIPISLSTKHDWPAASWFSYVNLRLNGLEFHKRLLAGKESYEDARVRKVFEELKLLIDGDYFNKNHAKQNWKEALPNIYREIAGMYLIGNFIVPQLKIPEERVGFFKFPIMDENIPVYEEAPTDVLFISNYSKKKKSAEKFLLYMAEANSQEKYNKITGYISPNTNSKQNKKYLTQIGTKILEEASGYSQFFDRDTSKAMAEESFKILADFFRDGDVDRVIRRLETARKKNFN